MSVNIKVTGGLNIEWGQIDPKVKGGLGLGVASLWILRLPKNVPKTCSLAHWTPHTLPCRRGRSEREWSSVSICQPPPPPPTLNKTSG